MRFLSCYIKHRTKVEYPPSFLTQAIYGNIQLSICTLPCKVKRSLCAISAKARAKGNFQVYINTTQIPVQALFSKIHKKNKKAVAVFAYNVAKFMPKLTLIFIHNSAYFRLKNYKKSVNQKIKPHFSIIHTIPKLETHWNSNVFTASCINIHNIHLKNKV